MNAPSEKPQMKLVVPRENEGGRKWGMGGA
jgi:hypothetical protein